MVMATEKQRKIRELARILLGIREPHPALDRLIDKPARRAPLAELFGRPDKPNGGGR